MSKDIQIIKDFLNSKKGYIKEGAGRLKNILEAKGIIVSRNACRMALRQCRQVANTTAERIKMEGAKILSYDIETSYNIGKFWRTGWNMTIHPGDIIHERAIICISYKWKGDDQIYNLKWDKNQDDKFMVEQFIEVLNEADLLVAHNGDRYDLKFIKTRALKHGLPMLLNYPQFDTLKVAKKKFMFNSNKLDYISEYLGFGNKIKTEMKLWDDIILRKCPEAMERMLKYCDMDVILLEKVYDKLVSWELPKLHVGVINNKDKFTSPITGGLNIELVKVVTTSRGTEKMIMKDLDTDRLFEMSAANYKKYNKNK